MRFYASPTTSPISMLSIVTASPAGGFVLIRSGDDCMHRCLPSALKLSTDPTPPGVHRHRNESAVRASIVRSWGREEVHRHDRGAELERSPRDRIDGTH